MHVCHNPSEIPSHVQWFRFALCKGRVSYEMGGQVGMNGTRCTIRARGLDPSLFLGARTSTRSNEFGTSISIQRSFWTSISMKTFWTSISIQTSSDIHFNQMASISTTSFGHPFKFKKNCTSIAIRNFNSR